MKKLLLILLSTFFLAISQASYSNNPALRNLKAEKKKYENQCHNLIQEYLDLGCPRYDDYTLFQKIFFPRWVHSCKEIDAQRENAAKTFLALDEAVQNLKKKK